MMPCGDTPRCCRCQLGFTSLVWGFTPTLVKVIEWIVHVCRYMATNEECKFVYNLVQVHIPHPVKLVMLKAKTKKNPYARKETPNLVCLKQIHEVFVGGAMSFKYLKVLVRLEVVPANTPSVSLITTSMAHNMLDHKQGVSAPIKAAMKAMHMQTLSMQLLPIPPHVMEPSPLGLPSPPAVVRMVEPFPLTLSSGYQLPANHAINYGLFSSKPQQAKMAPLNHQRSKFKVWCMTPIQLDRLGHAMVSSSHKQHDYNISLFLGHCHWFQGVAQPNMGEYLHPQRICEYISMKIAKEQSPDTIDHVLDTAQLVIRWWMAQPGGHHASLPRGITWLQTLSKQVSLMFEWCYHFHVLLTFVWI